MLEPSPGVSSLGRNIRRAPVPHPSDRFTNEDEAATAYDRAARLLLGPAGHLNFNEEDDADPCAAMHTAILLSQALGPGATPVAVQALAGGQGVPHDVAASVLAAQKPRRQLDARTILASQRRQQLLWVQQQQQQQQQLPQGPQVQLQQQSPLQPQPLPQPKERPPGQAQPQLQKPGQQLWRRQRQQKQDLRQDGAEQDKQQECVKQQVATQPQPRRVDAWAASTCLQHPRASSTAPAGPALDLESRQEPLQAPHHSRAATDVVVLPAQSVHADAAATSRAAARSTVTGLKEVVAGRGITSKFSGLGGTPHPPRPRGDETDELLDAMMQEAANLWEAPVRRSKPRRGVHAAQSLDRDAANTLPNPFAAAAAAMGPTTSPSLLLKRMESSPMPRPDLHSARANELLVPGRCPMVAAQPPSAANALSAFVAPADGPRPLSATAAAVSTAMARLEELLADCPEVLLAALGNLQTASPRLAGSPSTCQIHTAAVAAVQALVWQRGRGLAPQLP
jgi:hypothetical protein